jgi:hypothetical protein
VKPNTHIVILVFDEVVPRLQPSAAPSETLAQMIARGYQEPDDVPADRDSWGLYGVRSPNFKIVH